MKRMQHPQHGFAFAHNKLEEDAMIKAGWTDENQPAPTAAPQETTEQVSAPAATPEGAAPKAKRGPKPKA